MTRYAHHPALHSFPTRRSSDLEIAAVPELLRVLDLKGALVTMAAAGCQKATLRQIREQGGDYLVTVKGNQPALQKARSEEHTSELQSRQYLVCRLRLGKEHKHT